VVLPSDLEPRGLRPLAELPALEVADARRDVRGWEVVARNGEPLGIVSDLLVDPDDLLAVSVLLSRHERLSPRERADPIVPLSTLKADESNRRLVAGEGIAPIRLRYRSTRRITLWAGLAAAVILLLAWALGAFTD
jgi:hypothetical protein